MPIRLGVVAIAALGMLLGPLSVVASAATTKAHATSHATGTSVGGAYTALSSPDRICDTRAAGAGGSVQNQCSGKELTPGGTINVALPSSVPADATAVVVNVTETGATGSGYISAYPTGNPSTTSILNYNTGLTAANLATIGVGTGSSITIANGPATGGSVNVIVDLEGYYAPQSTASAAGTYVSISPARIADTRCFPSTKSFCSAENIPPANQDTTTLTAGSTQVIQATGVGGIPTAADVQDVDVNLTVIQPTANTFVSAYATGGAAPTTGAEFSNINANAGSEVVGNVIVPVNASGQFTIYNNNGNTNVAVDVNGYFASAAGVTGSYFTPLATPVRVLGTTAAGATIEPGASAATTVAGADGVPTNATAAALNVTDIQPAKGNFLTVYPSDEHAPVASQVDWIPANPYNVTADSAYGGLSETINGDAVPVGSFSVLNGPANTDNNAGPTSVDADLFGYFAPSGPIAISANPSSLPADGTSTSTITVVVSSSSGPTAGDPIALALSGTCGSTAPSAGVTNASGVFQSTYTASTTAGTCTVTATEADSGKTAATTITQTSYNSVTVTPATAAVPANGVATQVFTATVKNGAGTVVAGDTVTFTLSGGSACGSVSPTSGTTNSLGEVTTTYTASTTSGFCSLTATESQYGGSGSASIDQTAAPTPANAPFVVTTLANPPSVPSNGTSTSTIVATVKNSAGAVVPNDPVAFSTSGAVCGTVSPTGGVTNSSGQVTVTYTASTLGAGNCDVTATEAYTGSSGTAVVAQTNVNSVSVSANPSNLPDNGTSTSTITATVDNAAGVPQSGDAVTFSVTPVGGASCGSITSTNPVDTNSAGQATATYKAGTGVGFCTVTATEANTAQSGSTTVVQTSQGTPSSVTVSANPGTLAADGMSTSALTVTVTSSTGAPVANDPVALTESGAACGGVAPASGTTNASGQFSSTYTASTVAGSCTITATEADQGHTGSTTITQSPFNTVTLNPGSVSLPASGLASQTFTATVTSNGATPVSGDTVTFTTSGYPAAACGTLSNSSATTNASGEATVTYTTSTTSGFCDLTAKESQYGGTATAVIDQTASPAPGDTPFTVTASTPAESTPANGSAASNVSETFTVENSGAVAVPNDPVLFTDNGAAACGTLTPSNATTNASGQVTVTYTPNTTVGNCTITATEAYTGASGNATVTQTAVRNVAVTATPSTVTGNGTSTSTVVATVTDGAGNPVVGDTVDFTVTTVSGGACGSVLPASGVTNASGQVSTTYTSGVGAAVCKVTATDTTTAGSGSVQIVQTS